MRTFIILYALTLNCTRSVRDASINALNTNDPDMQSRGLAMTSYELGPSMAKNIKKRAARRRRWFHRLNDHALISPMYMHVDGIQRIETNALDTDPRSFHN